MVLDKATLERRRVKVENFLRESSVKLPLVNNYTEETSEVNLTKNKAFQKILKDTILKEIVRTIEDDIRKDDFFKIDRYQWLKSHINFNIRNKQASSEFKQAIADGTKFLLRNHKDFLIKEYNTDVLLKTMKAVTPIAQKILLSSMVVDSMSDCDYNWLDFSMSLQTTGLAVCESEILLVGIDNVNHIVDVAADYIDHEAVMLSLFIFKLFRQLDDTSKEQLIGNLGSMYETRDAIEYAFSRELLSKKVNTKWLIEAVIKNREMLEADTLSAYLAQAE